ncbi:MAG: TIGR03088 family PEP-CTERM/XrtA system glycosyltransferase [Magnetococcales bacterium]|nr:TIGR03088 family PEP-CTERM/XrtA system glycosyltransferase [Magnetococcales bacterium]
MAASPPDLPPHGEVPPRGASPRTPVLVAHLVYRLDVGGLETVLANVIDGLDPGRFRHAVIALTEVTAFRERIRAPQVSFHALGKREGKDLAVWVRLWRLLRHLRPAILHTLNIATLEGVVPAFLAGVPVRIHAEHGRDSYDLDGSNRKYRLLRQLLMPLVDRVVPVSHDLERWLLAQVKVPPAKVRFIMNGIDQELYRPAHAAESRGGGYPPGFGEPGCRVIGTVGRLWAVKDHANLLRAFALLRQEVERRSGPGERRRLRLVVVGDGPLRPELTALAARLEIADAVWITGWRGDVAVLMRRFDLFVLSSLAEGSPLTVLEAMATALPVVATRVGGVADLLAGDDGQLGRLVPAADPAALAAAMGRALADPEWLSRQGREGRTRVERCFGRERMVAAYRDLFLAELSTKVP